MFFGRRPDGKKVKGLDGITRLMPLVMPNRDGSTNYLVITLPTKPFEEYIAAKKAEGIDYSFLDVFIAALVRWFKLRPKLNRFIVGGRYYQHKYIDFAMMVHKNLRTGEDETAVKMRFTGDETIAEIKKQINAEFDKAFNSTNNSDSFTDGIVGLPHFLYKMVSGFIRLFDHWGLLSDKFLSKTSPFHSSIFLTDMRSIDMDYVHHHLYNFGTCSFFAALGKEKFIPVADQTTGELSSEKVVEVGISQDDRATDGLYWSLSLRKYHRIIENLSCLDRPPSEGEISKIRTVKEIKAERKKIKAERKAEKKAAKKVARKAKKQKKQG